MNAARRASIPYVLALPVLFFLGLFFLSPLGNLIALSFLVEDRDGTTSLSLAVYGNVLGDSYYLWMFWRTFYISFLTTIVSFILALPVALYARHASPLIRSIIILIILAPLLTSVVVRTLAWVYLLGPSGFVNSGLTAIGLYPVEFLYNTKGVVIGLTHVLFGYMVLSLMPVCLRINEDLLLAASNLGASRWVILVEIIFPLILPGVLAGSILVFTLSASTYATPQLLGGSSAKMLAVEIYDVSIRYLDWAEAGALSLLLMIGITAVVLTAAWLLRRGPGKGVFV